VDQAEYLDILDEAVSARNGWKRIFARCTYKRVTVKEFLETLRAKPPVSPGD